MFEAAYPGTVFAEMIFGYASNAIAGFLSAGWRSTTPVGSVPAGDDAAMTEVQLRGARNFLSARCSICHNARAHRQRVPRRAVAQFGRVKATVLGSRRLRRERETAIRPTATRSARHRFGTWS